MNKSFEKPLVTVSGNKSLFKADLHRRIVQDLPQEGVDWRRRLETNSKSVYVDVDFVDFDVDNVERASERLSRLSVGQLIDGGGPATTPNQTKNHHQEQSSFNDSQRVDDEDSDEHEYDKNNIAVDRDDSPEPKALESIQFTIDESMTQEEEEEDGIEDDNLVANNNINKLSDQQSDKDEQQRQLQDELEAANRSQQNDISQAFFNQKLLGRPILHTYWADKADFDDDNQKSQFDEWIGQVQASNCTEWAIVIIEDGDFKAQFGTALFKSKLQSSSSSSQANASSSSINSLSHHHNQASSALSSSSSTATSFLDRMKKGLSTMFQNDSNSDRWLTLVNQTGRANDTKAQESYVNFMRKFRKSIMASFSKQIELFEEQLRVQREMRTDKSWNFLSYFSMQEELAFAFEFLTLFDEALLQYDLLEALFSEYISSTSFNEKDDPLYENWIRFNKQWPTLCLDMNCDYSIELRRRIVDRKEASLLEFRNYLFAKQCDLMLMQNQPWRVAASTPIFLNNCIREHEYLQIESPPGALTCWCFTSALEVLQKCECYSCTSTMENYSKHTIDIWNCARKKLVELGRLVAHSKAVVDGEHRTTTTTTSSFTDELLASLGPDPHDPSSSTYQQQQGSEISPQARLRDALSGRAQFAKHLIEMTELTLGTFKHLGRKRHALLVGKELADFYIDQGNVSRAAPFLMDLEKLLQAEQWTVLLDDVRQSIEKISISDQRSSSEPSNGGGGDVVEPDKSSAAASS